MNSTWKHAVAFAIATSLFGAVACNGEDISLGSGEQKLSKDSNEPEPGDMDDTDSACKPDELGYAFDCVAPATAFNVQCAPVPGAGTCACSGQCAVFDPGCDPHACDGQAAACVGSEPPVSTRCVPGAGGHCILLVECAP